MRGARPELKRAQEKAEERGVNPQRDPQRAAAATQPGWPVYFVVGVTMTALGAMAVPRPEPEPAITRILPATIEREQALVRALETWRAALQSYREHHAVFPGFQPGRAGALMHGPLDESRIVPQLVLSTDAWGNTAAIGMSGFPHRPCLSNGAPVNPVNGLATLRVLDADDAFAATADGATGWVYKPSTGEIRLNAPGSVAVTGLPYWEL